MVLTINGSRMKKADNVLINTWLLPQCYPHLHGMWRRQLLNLISKELSKFDGSNGISVYQQEAKHCVDESIHSYPLL